MPVDPSCVAAVDDAAALLAELGHDVVEATPPWAGEDLILHFTRIWQVGPATAGIDDLSLLEPINRMLAEQARETPSPEHAAAIMQLQRLTRDGRRVLGRRRRASHAHARSAACADRLDVRRNGR